MEIFNYKRMVPYSSEQMFDLVSDPEHYPEFLPGW
jgi:ribosome-associated toxin RatA of RatAB toxin-antitoxin module